MLITVYCFYQVFFLTDAENNALFFFFFFQGSAAWSRVSGTWGWPESDRLPNRGFRLISWPLRCSRSACKFYYSQPCFSATADVLLLTVSVYQRSQMASATPVSRSVSEPKRLLRRTFTPFGLWFTLLGSFPWGSLTITLHINYTFICPQLYCYSLQCVYTVVLSVIVLRSSGKQKQWGVIVNLDLCVNLPSVRKEP